MYKTLSIKGIAEELEKKSTEDFKLDFTLNDTALILFRMHKLLENQQLIMVTLARLMRIAEWDATFRRTHE